MFDIIVGNMCIVYMCITRIETNILCPSQETTLVGRASEQDQSSTNVSLESVKFEDDPAIRKSKCFSGTLLFLIFMTLVLVWGLIVWNIYSMNHLYRYSRPDLSFLSVSSAGILSEATNDAIAYLKHFFDLSISEGIQNTNVFINSVSEFTKVRTTIIKIVL